MGISLRPEEPLSKLEEEAVEETRNELEKDLAALGIAVTAYYVELMGLSQKEKERKKWEKALEKWAEKKSEEGPVEGRKPWALYKDREAQERKEGFRFFTITTAGVEEVDVGVDEEEVEAQPVEEQAVDVALVSREAEALEEVIAQPLINEQELEKADELVKMDEEQAVDVLVVESPQHIEEAMERKAHLIEVIEEREHLLEKALEESKRRKKEDLREWLMKKLPPLLRAKYLIILERVGPEGIRKMARRDMEVLSSFKEKLKKVSVREIVAWAHKMAKGLLERLRRLFS